MRGETSNNVPASATTTTCQTVSWVNADRIPNATTKNAAEPSSVRCDRGQLICPQMRPITAAAASASMNVAMASAETYRGKTRVRNREEVSNQLAAYVT